MMIRIVLLLLVLSPSLAAAEQTAKKPFNVVILYADDWRHDTLGCAGNPVVKTPHLDRLARSGFRFTYNCVTTSICGVSRASLLTGQWMSRHGNRAFGAFKTPWAETLPGLLRAAGYWVGYVGKWHCGPFPGQHFDFGRAYAGTHWIKQAKGEPVHVTRKNELDALDFLRDRPKDKPFALTLSFFATHAEDRNPKQYLPQPESMSLYQDVVVPTPRTATEAHFRQLPPFLANEKNEGRNRWHWRFDTPVRYQEYMKNYYRLATEVDAVCGKVIDELRKQGVLENTIVIFTTDNGYFHGEHGLADKWYPFDESIRVPLIVHDPRLPAEKQGGTNAAFTLNVDIAPTILNAVGITTPGGMQGRDFAPLYLSPSEPNWRTDFFYEHAVIRSKDFIPASEALIGKEWRYFQWPDFDYEQLFHIRVDPHEENDLARNAEYAAELARLRQRFSTLKAAVQKPQ